VRLDLAQKRHSIRRLLPFQAHTGVPVSEASTRRLRSPPGDSSRLLYLSRSERSKTSKLFIATTKAVTNQLAVRQKHIHCFEENYAFCR